MDPDPDPGTIVEPLLEPWRSKSINGCEAVWGAGPAASFLQWGETGSAATPPKPEGKAVPGHACWAPPQDACQPGVGAPTRAEWAEKWANWALNESIIRIICRVGRPVRGLSTIYDGSRTRAGAHFHTRAVKPSTIGNWVKSRISLCIKNYPTTSATKRFTITQVFGVTPR